MGLIEKIIDEIEKIPAEGKRDLRIRERLTDKERDVIRILMVALRDAEEKHPDPWPKDLIHLTAFMGEEAGESLQAAIDIEYGRERRLAPLIKEVAQTGAMAIRILVALVKRLEAEEG